MMDVQDNYDAFEAYEREQARIHRRIKKIAHEWEEKENIEDEQSECNS